MARKKVNMRPSKKVLDKLKKLPLPEKFLKAIMRDFKLAFSVYYVDSIGHKQAQRMKDLMFDVFLNGNLNAIDMTTKFGKMCSPFITVSPDTQASLPKVKDQSP